MTPLSRRARVGAEGRRGTPDAGAQRGNQVVPLGDKVGYGSGRRSATAPAHRHEGFGARARGAGRRETR